MTSLSSPLTGAIGLAKPTNGNGMRLLDFAYAYELVVRNTLFQHKRIHTTTWYSPSGHLQPIVKDFILVNTLYDYDCRVKRRLNFGSDHKLVVSKLVLKLQKSKMTNKQIAKIFW